MSETKYLIKKNGFWYRPNSQGYTKIVSEAGRYSLEEAEAITYPNGLNGSRDGMSYIAVEEAMPVPVAVGRNTEEEWKLEQWAFVVANDDNVPEYARELVSELWLQYCLASSEEEPSRAAQPVAWGMTDAGGADLIEASISKSDFDFLNSPINEGTSHRIIPLYAFPKHTEEGGSRDQVLEEAARVAESFIKDPDDLSRAKDASIKGDLYFGGHYLPYDTMAAQISAAIRSMKGHAKVSATSTKQTINDLNQRSLPLAEQHEVFRAWCECYRRYAVADECNNCDNQF